jgi:hypothetical protein
MRDGGVNITISSSSDVDKLGGVSFYGHLDLQCRFCHGGGGLRLPQRKLSGEIPLRIGESSPRSRGGALARGYKPGSE